MSLFNLINQFAGKWPWLDSLAIFFAKYFEYVLIFGLFLLLVIEFKKYWKPVIQALASAIFARFVIANIIYWIWQRSRPFVDNSVNLLIDYPDRASFPSGHAVFYFTLSTIIFFYNKKIGILFLIGSFLICLARVFVGIHWPSDVLAGAFIGILISWLVFNLVKKKALN